MLIYQLEKPILLKRFERQWSLLNNILKCSTQTNKVLSLYYYDLYKVKYSVMQEFKY